MARTGVVIDDRFLTHDTGPGHPERPQRVAVLFDVVREREAALVRVPARAATADELALVHDGRHVEHVAATEKLAHYAFDADTPASSESYSAARLAAGGLLALLDEIADGRLDNGFALVRPPGHHAERLRAMGFCLFNNAAVGAEYLRRRHGLERVLVVDWDLHHGNGTQHLFESEPGVLYVSTHQYPYYPGTGAEGEQGVGAGEGFTINLPFPAGFGNAEYAEAFRAVIEPIAHEYRPQFVLISAGFDGHARDPLGGMAVTEPGFRFMARSLLDVARACSGGRCAAVLEGGYDLTAIRHSVAAVLDEMAGERPELPDFGDAERARGVLERVRRAQRRVWRL
jgi:acetoin utilization deacetylase AcuC-like enzyme